MTTINSNQMIVSHICLHKLQKVSEYYWSILLMVYLTQGFLKILQNQTPFYFIAFVPEFSIFIKFRLFVMTENILNLIIYDVPLFAIFYNYTILNPALF